MEEAARIAWITVTICTILVQIERMLQYLAEMPVRLLNPSNPFSPVLKKTENHCKVDIYHRILQLVILITMFSRVKWSVLIFVSLFLRSQIQSSAAIQVS